MVVCTCVHSCAERLRGSADPGDLASRLRLDQAMLHQNRTEIPPPQESAGLSSQASLGSDRKSFALNNTYAVEFTLKRCGFCRYGLQGFV